MIQCPLYQHNIDDEVCFDICMVAEEMSPARFVDNKIRKIENYKEICLTCKNHKE